VANRELVPVRFPLGARGNAKLRSQDRGSEHDMAAEDTVEFSAQGLVTKTRLSKSRLIPA
jgi:hypothetical protein